MRSCQKRSRPSRMATGASCTANNDHGLDGWQVLDGLVHRGLERQALTAPHSAIGGEDDLRLERLETISQGAGGEAGEHGIEERANAEAGQDGDDGFPQVRRKNGDGIALPDAEVLQHVGALAHLDEEHPIGEEARLAVLPLPDERETVVGAPRQVAIEQVDRRVAHAAHEILEMRKASFLHHVPRPHPLQFARNVGPELVGTLSRSREQCLPGFDTSAVRRPRALGLRNVQPARTDETDSAFVRFSHGRDSTRRHWRAYQYLRHPASEVGGSPGGDGYARTDDVARASGQPRSWP